MGVKLHIKLDTASQLSKNCSVTAPIFYKLLIIFHVKCGNEIEKEKQRI